MLVKSIVITGNTVFDNATLQPLVADGVGKRLTLAGIQQLADRITAYYHAHDYPFAQTLVPAQASKNGQLRIAVVEGRYGARTVNATGKDALSAQAFLAPLKQGEVIQGAPLERATLILNDQPGYAFTPVIRPGKTDGTGDLQVNMVKQPHVGGSLSADDYGNHYTGRYRGLADAYMNSALTFGDKVTLDGIYTNENMWFGSAGYELPLGTSGLRGNVGYTHTYYELGGDFESLDAHGTADIASVGISYPLVRSQTSNLSAAVNFQHKWLRDEQDSTATNNTKASNLLPVSLNFDHRDGLLGGGVTYGSTSWTHGVLDLNANLASSDAGTASSNGDFDKLNIDMARIQALPLQNLTLYVRGTGQLAGNNLDSSEDFGLGGPTGVRAYPTGEGYGDSGWLAQTELRYSLNMFTPYAFYDYGQVKINENPWAAGKNQRSLGGGGVGLRFTYRGWQADASAAWRTVGGAPQSDTQDAIPQLWLTAGYHF
jgi:hemolysin activation/secretion protein